MKNAIATVGTISRMTATVRSVCSFMRVSKFPTKGIPRPMQIISIVVYSVSVDRSQPMSVLTG